MHRFMHVWMDVKPRNVRRSTIVWIDVDMQGGGIVKREEMNRSKRCTVVADRAEETYI